MQSGKAEVKCTCERFDGESFGESRHSFEQDVAIAQQADEKTVDKLVLTYQNSRDLLSDGSHPRTRLSNSLRKLLGIRCTVIHD